MRENILKLPAHLRRQRIVSAEQVAMAMAGIYECTYLSQFNHQYDPETSNVISSYFRVILHAVKEEGLQTIRVGTDYNGKLSSAEFYADDIWPWALNELSYPDSWFGIDNPPTQNVIEHETSACWGDFAGKDTALLMIASLATALEKTGGKYTRSNKLNKSAVISTAIKAVNDYGNGTDLTDRALRRLIDNALAQYVPKLEE